MIHLWTAILAVTLDGPLWLLAPTGIPAVFYLSSWWLLKERRRDDLLLLETGDAGAAPRGTAPDPRTGPEAPSRSRKRKAPRSTDRGAGRTPARGYFGPTHTRRCARRA
ncbi:hypothetical protein ACU686_06905 [Yinghuangia aomiensis]